jgi:uroporphyrinogen-III decarboxylase
MNKMGKDWSGLSPEEKREERFNKWLSPPDVFFSSPEAEKMYKQRVQRFIDAVKIKEPDRVPVVLPSGFFPAYYAGTTFRTVMYDYDELRRAWLKFLQEFEMDAYTPPGLVFPGKVYEALDYKLYHWPGHGLPENTPTYQFVEGEYMKEDEYDLFLKDPLDFTLRYYLPRTVGALASFRNMGAFSHVLGMPLRFLPLATMPDIRAAFQALADAGTEYAKWQDVVREVGRIAIETGFPPFRGPVAVAPFDTFADTLRGTKGIVMDMYRRPDKLHEAMEKVTPMTLESTISSSNSIISPLVFIPLHKGDDVFMSDSHYETFYWPSLKKVIVGLIDEGLVPLLFAEGKYNHRLGMIKDVPKGSVIWHFDQTDMARAKEVLGNTSCIAGNIPTSILHTGSPKEVKEYCRKLIEVCGKGGGYILTGGANIDEGNPDNFRAIMEAAKAYGLYK